LKPFQTVSSLISVDVCIIFIVTDNQLCSGSGSGVGGAAASKGCHEDHEPRVSVPHRKAGKSSQLCSRGDAVSMIINMELEVEREIDDNNETSGSDEDGGEDLGEVGVWYNI